MAFTQESEPLKDLETLIRTNWPEYTEAPKPNINIQNPGDQISEDIRMMFDFNEGDWINLKTSESPEQIRYRGNITYIDKVHQIEIDVYSVIDRQRLRNLYKVLRMIFLTKKHDFPNWQLVRMLSWQEFVNEQFNMWKGMLRLQLENHAVLADSLT